MFGSILIALTLGTALISTVAYGMAMRTETERERYVRIGRATFHTTVIGFMVACALMMYLIVTHQFQYTYIWSHSSRTLSTPLLMATFYAGQEGSFMLWTLLVCLIGVFVIGYSQRVRYEAPVMTIFMLVVACLLLILVVKSPFHTIWQSFPEQNIAANKVIADGKGLNPQLENLWITIHPPILFMGFAAMTVPFVFALAGLIRRDYQRWISIALPWTLFASMVLGFGIMLGGWWAYETLGWGGFWAWDPVENSSLIPWLVCVAMVHTMLVQKRTGGTPANGKIGGLVKTNFLLAIAAFGLILYSTFLTRSGILGDTSVHSFVSPGGFVYGVLLVTIILFMAIGLGILAWRWKDLNLKALDLQLMSRETALSIGSAVLLSSAFIVLLGTSFPILMPLFGMPKVAIPITFYNQTHIPLAMMIVLLNSISMTLKWKNTTRDEFWKKLRVSLAISVVGTIGLWLLEIHDPLYLALGFGSVMAMVVNVQLGAKILRGNRSFVGAYVSHAGVALLLLGVIFTSRYSVTEHVRLVQGETGKIHGYDITYLGSEQIELEKTDREKFQHNVVLERDGSRHEAKPITFLSDFNKRESPFLEPGIIYSVSKDVYITPKALENVGGDPRFELHKGDSVRVPFDSSIVVKFVKFDMSRGQSEGMQGAVMEARVGDSVHYLTSDRELQGGRYQPVRIPGTDIAVGFGDIIVDRETLGNSQAVLVFTSPRFPAPPSKMAIALEVSIKPFISFVWIGVITMVSGFFFAIIRRRKEIDLWIPPDDNDNGNDGGEEVVTETTSRRARKVSHATPENVEEPTAARIATRR